MALGIRFSLVENLATLDMMPSICGSFNENPSGAIISIDGNEAGC